MPFFILSEISIMLLTCSWTYKIVTICTGFDVSSCMRFIGADPFKSLCREYGSMMNYRQEMDWLPDTAGKPGRLMVDVGKDNTHQAGYWWKLDILNLKAAVPFEWNSSMKIKPNAQVSFARTLLEHWIQFLSFIAQDDKDWKALKL